MNAIIECLLFFSFLFDYCSYLFLQMLFHFNWALLNDENFNLIGCLFQSRLTQSNGAAMNKNGQENKDCPFMSYETTKRLSLKHAKELDKMARIFFPLTFLLFNIIYWVTYSWLRRSQVPKPNY